MLLVIFIQKNNIKEDLNRDNCMVKGPPHFWEKFLKQTSTGYNLKYDILACARCVNDWKIRLGYKIIIKHR